MNKAIIMGRLTKDVDLRTLQSGAVVASFTVAVDRRFKNKQGEKETDFIMCTAWQKTAEFISQYFQKGSMIAVVGEIQTRNYDDKDGKRVYITEVNVNEAYFTGSSERPQGQQGGAVAYNGHGSQQREYNGSVGQSWGDYNSTGSPKGMEHDDTGLPFSL